MSDIPPKAFDREILQISLREIFEKDEDGNYINFDSTINRNQCILKYRIAPHQRYHKKSLKDKWDIIDSVFRNYIIGGISFSRHPSTNGVGTFYFNIEDGQSRLTIIQEYIEDGFKYKDKFFNDLSDFDKQRFMGYIFSQEITTPSRISRNINMTIDDHHFENFDRINRGTSLSDNDKYWCHKHKPMVKFSFDLIAVFKTERLFMCTEKFSSEKRNVLENICTLVGMNLYDVYKKSYSRHMENLNTEITNMKKNNVYDFMNHYSNIHDKIYEDFPRRQGEHILQFNNPGKFLSMIVRDYKVQREGISNTDKVNMWADILNINRSSDNFMKGSYTLYNFLNEGDKKNQEISNIDKRLERIILFYNDKQTISNQYNIEYSPYYF